MLEGSAETSEPLSEVQVGLEDRLGPEAKGEGWQPQIIQVLQNNHTDKRAEPHSLTRNTAQAPGSSPCLQVGGSELAWVEAGVHPKGRNTGQEPKALGQGIGRRPTQNLSSACGGIRGHGRSGRPLGTWPETLQSAIGPPATPPSPTPPAAILASKGPVNTRDTSTNDQG